MSAYHEHTDLFAGGHRHLAHGVNTHGVMGAGIAAVFAKRYPGLLDDYRLFIETNGNPVGKCFIWAAIDGSVIYNLFSQDRPGANARTEWLTSALRIATLNLTPGAALHMPWIGAGIGGLTQYDVARTVASVADERPAIDIVVHTHPNEQYDADAVRWLS